MKSSLDTKRKKMFSDDNSYFSRNHFWDWSFVWIFFFVKLDIVQQWSADWVLLSLSCNWKEICLGFLSLIYNGIKTLVRSHFTILPDMYGPSTFCHYQRLIDKCFICATILWITNIKNCKRFFAHSIQQEIGEQENLRTKNQDI